MRTVENQGVTLMSVARVGVMVSAALLGCLVLTAPDASASDWQSGYGIGPYRRCLYFDWSAPTYLGWYGYCTPGAVPFPAYFPPGYCPPNYSGPFAPLPATVAPKGNSVSASGSTSGAGVLYVKVPAAARVSINGMLTKTTGEMRRYALPGLVAGATYKYQVRVELPGTEQSLEETQTVILSAGDEQQLTFEMSATAAGVANAPAKPRPSVTSRAPADVR